MVNVFRNIYIRKSIIILFSYIKETNEFKNTNTKWLLNPITFKSNDIEHVIFVVIWFVFTFKLNNTMLLNLFVVENLLEYSNTFDNYFRRLFIILFNRIIIYTRINLQTPEPLKSYKRHYYISTSVQPLTKNF